MIRCIVIFSMLIFFSSCKNAAPAGIVKQDKMQEILWDIFRADALSRQIVSTDSSKSQPDENAKLTGRVFLIHNITREQFDKSYNYYAQHPDIMRTMLDSINAQQERINNWEITHRRTALSDSSKPPIK
jgi:hypothetical protein